MNKFYHINAAPRGADSRTLKVANAVLNNFKATYPAAEIDRIDVFDEDLPPLTVKQLDGKYALMGGKDLSGDLKAAWEKIVEHIERFLSADTYLVSTPMWNFGIPYHLKHYIDVIAQPRYTFRYTTDGPEGLAKGKKMIVVSSRGGDYSASEQAQAMDQIVPYLKTVFGFIGISDITFINAQPMDAAGPEVAQQKLSEAIEQAKALKL